MERLFMLFGDVSDLKSGGGDTWCDRLNSKYTVYIMVFFALMVTTRHFVDEPIACYAPSHFTASHCKFLDKVCWTQDTYYLPLSEGTIPKDKQHISYYQWVGLILIFQAIFFYLPSPLWHLLSTKSGIAVGTVTDAGFQCQRQTESDNKKKVIKYIVNNMGRFLLELSREQLMSNKCKGIWWLMYGNYLIITYLIIKLIYLVNIIAQFIWLNNFLGGFFLTYGFHVFSRMIVGKRWSLSHRFPRVTLCDVSIRELGSINNYTVQCALPLNLFNESIFIFLWMWFLILFLATACSMATWIVQSFYFVHHYKYVKRRLTALSKIDNENFPFVKSFVRNFLRGDGMFLIQMLSKSSSDIVAAEVLCGLWEFYLKNRRVIERLESHIGQDICDEDDDDDCNDGDSHKSKTGLSDSKTRTGLVDDLDELS